MLYMESLIFSESSGTGGLLRVGIMLQSSLRRMGGAGRTTMGEGEEASAAAAALRRCCLQMGAGRGCRLRAAPGGGGGGGGVRSATKVSRTAGGGGGSAGLLLLLLLLPRSTETVSIPKRLRESEGLALLLCV